ncbi:Uncharacterized membrane protein [Natronoarchaeum philippinense]|uniref:Uncharacterized membrane protein n=1 Tax=Natronoarchaeum philippinense TaxID=558529 RepID=A0A285N967_NATPI|nr:DUF2085 domain-containing protein [Natronoarchaeum philippinense]SNZ06044.1 Uncharacterized membrane protein [Natronoarchaeum philippinense]
MEVDTAELRRGLRRTRRYLLSHHRPAEYHRCYSPELRGRRIHVCARCLGIYPGIVVGMLGYVLGPWRGTAVLLAAILPLPALVDWTLTTFRESDGHNFVRTATGALLGCGYGLGLAALVLGANVRVLGIGIAYGLTAAALLSISTTNE